MASIDGPTPIITDGVLFAVDAGNTRCFTPGSATGTDLIENLTLTLSNEAGYNSSGGGCFEFDGTDDYITVSSTPFTSLTTFSVIAWVSPDSNAGGYRSFFSGRNGSNDYTSGVTVGQGSSTQTSFKYLNCEFAGDGGGAVDLMTSDIAFGIWTHLAITMTTGTCQLYVNGAAEGNRDNDGSTMSFTNIQIGARYFGGAVQGDLDGKIGPLYFYNRALTSVDILQNYKATKSRFGL